jgi:hypothetical protein
MMLLRLLVVLTPVLGCMVVLVLAVLGVLRDLLDSSDHEPPGMQNFGDAM